MIKFIIHVAGKLLLMIRYGRQRIKVRRRLFLETVTGEIDFRIPVIYLSTD